MQLDSLLATSYQATLGPDLLQNAVAFSIHSGTIGVRQGDHRDRWLY
jgi:hypothetical protein